jgi:hypothetical protein
VSNRNLGAGFGALQDITSAAYTTALGFYSAKSVTTAQRGIYLGAYSGYYSTTETGELIINAYDQGSRALDVTDSLIYGVMKDNDPTTQTLRINGAVTLGTTDARAHLTFQRGGYNYITTPTDGTLAFVMGGLGISDANSALVLLSTGEARFNNKLMFTQTDGNESIDSANDGYMDYYATIQHRFHADTDIDGDLTASNVAAVHKTAAGSPAVADGTYVMGIGTATNGTITIVDGIITAVTECANA